MEHMSQWCSVAAGCMGNATTPAYLSASFRTFVPLDGKEYLGCLLLRATTGSRDHECPPPPPTHTEGAPLPLSSSVWTRHRAVKQGQPRGSVGTAYQGKGRVCKEGRIGQTGRSRALGGGGERPMGTTTCGGKRSKERTCASGERPMGAASFRQQSIQASCQPPPPPGVDL